MLWLGFMLGLGLKSKLKLLFSLKLIVGLWFGWGEESGWVRVGKGVGERVRKVLGLGKG